MIQCLRIALASLFCLAFTAPTNSAGIASLRIGEMRLPSGAVIRGVGAAYTAEALKQQLHENFAAQMTRTPQQNLEALKLIQVPEEFTVNLDLLTLPDGGTVQSVCDEYVNSNIRFQPKPIAVSLKRLVISVKEPRQTEAQKCEYDIQGSALTHDDGSSIQELGLALQTVQDAESTFAIIPLSAEQRVDVQFPVRDVLISVPFSLSEVARLEHFLIEAGQLLYPQSAYRNSVIRFIAVQDYASAEAYLLPARILFAFQSEASHIFLVENITLRLMALQPKGSRERKIGEFVQIQTLNLRLSDAAAAGKAIEAFAGDTSDVFQDATEVFGTAGRYAASAFQVSQVVVNYHTVVPGSRVGLDIPVKFELDGDNWRMTSKIK